MFLESGPFAVHMHNSDEISSENFGKKWLLHKTKSEKVIFTVFDARIKMSWSVIYGQKIHIVSELLFEMDFCPKMMLHDIFILASKILNTTFSDFDFLSLILWWILVFVIVAVSFRAQKDQKGAYFDLFISLLVDY